MEVRTPATKSGLSDSEKRELVKRIVQSPALAGSRALQLFLHFVCEHAISGDLENIKEHRIGCEVLGRKADYDPAVDNIVRVRAHELRQRLAKYFTTTGIAEPYIVTIPSGSYVPQFQLRVAETLPEAAEPDGGAARARNRAGKGWTQAQWSAVRDLWGQFFPDSGQGLAAVASDATFALWQDVTGNNLNLGEYLSRRYLELGEPQLREVAARRCVSQADLNISMRLAEITEALGGRVRPHFARNLTMSELRTGNSVLMGSRRSNPWVQLFEPRLNFVLVLDSASGGPQFHNRSPRDGEGLSFAIPCSLDIEGTERTELECYALVALVPNLSDTGRVLLLEGLSMEGTEAAGESVTNPEWLAAMLRQIGHRPGTTVQPFEVLLQLTSMPGGYANPKVVAFRYPAEPVEA
jgi:hypothetical protein